MDPLHAPHVVGLAVVPVIEIGGLTSTNGPMAGVAQPELSVATMLLYVPAQRPVSVADPVAFVVTTTGA